MARCDHQNIISRVHTHFLMLGQFLEAMTTEHNHDPTFSEVGIGGAL